MPDQAKAKLKAWRGIFSYHRLIQDKSKSIRGFCVDPV